MSVVPRSIFVRRGVSTSVSLLHEKPKNLKGKKHSSQLWLIRQIRDPYVEKAKQDKYRCRSAFKLLEINERFNVLSPGHVVIDCGASPGSWTQVAVKLTNASGVESGPVGSVYGLDKLPIYPIENATVLGNKDILEASTFEELTKLLRERKANVVLSDMAPNATGVKDLDHDNIIILAYYAMKFALKVTQIGGSFVTKIWDGRKTVELERDLSTFYKTVKYFRPNASRSESSETFIVAKDFKGLKTNTLSSA